MKFRELSQKDYNTKLGYGEKTISEVGCTLTSLAMFAGTNPHTLNEVLKGTSFKDSAFAGPTKNLIWWTKLEKYTKGLIKFHWRGYNYDETKIKEAISKWGACLGEVDFDGAGPKENKHWILAKGDQKANDPYTGNEIPTSKYPIWTGWAEIEVNQKEDTSETPLESCLRDREGFWKQRDTLHGVLGVDNQADALAEIRALQEKEQELKKHKCPEPISKPCESIDNMTLNGKSITYKIGDKTHIDNYLVNHIKSQ